MVNLELLLLTSLHLFLWCWLIFFRYILQWFMILALLNIQILSVCYILEQWLILFNEEFRKLTWDIVLFRNWGVLILKLNRGSKLNFQVMDLIPPFVAFICWYYYYDFLGGRVLSNHSCYGSLLWHYDQEISWVTFTDTGSVCANLSRLSFKERKIK